MQIKLHQLRAFNAVAEQGSIRSASRMLSTLIDQGLIRSTSRVAALEPGLPFFSLRFLFPGLWPEAEGVALPRPSITIE